ncbi:hypothetical protein [Pseudonocardia sp. GCM10023141]|uniref:hypothetical protein n=1 Tax=Pseudonocardia sp. GCM10023141 TaxID=3252653 RepID=UPI0036238350
MNIDRLPGWTLDTTTAHRVVLAAAHRVMLAYPEAIAYLVHDEILSSWTALKSTWISAA